MRSSKKRKVAGLEMKRFTAVLELEVYEKLSELAGDDSLSHTMHRLIVWGHKKVVNKQLAQIRESSLNS